MPDTDNGKPSYITRLEWFRENWHRYILHFLLLLSLAANVYLFRNLDNLAREYLSYRNLAEQRLIDYQGCRTQSPWGDPPLQVNFADSAYAYVNFYHVSIPTESRAIDASHDPRSYSLAYESMLNIVKSEVFAKLESIDLATARRDRLSIASELRESINARIGEPNIGFELTEFSLLEFCTPNV